MQFCDYVDGLIRSMFKSIYFSADGQWSGRHTDKRIHRVLCFVNKSVMHKLRK